MSRLSPKMLKVLRKLAKVGWQDAIELKCSISTLIALERRKLIRVETTFNSIAFPRTAHATITDAGKVAAFQLYPGRVDPGVAQSLKQDR